MDLWGHLEGKEGGVHNPVTKRWADCSGSRKEEALEKEWFLPEDQAYCLLVNLTRGHFLSAEILALDMKA